jgi:ribosomal protection tetracycline resistance protein
VCAPASEFEVEIPARSISQVLHELQAAGATLQPPVTGETRCRVMGIIATEQVQGFEQRLPGLTQGEGIFFSQPAGCEPVQGPPPARALSGAGRTAPRRP